MPNNRRPEPTYFVKNGFTQQYSSIIQTITVVALFVGGFWAGVISPIQFNVHEAKKEGFTVREHREFSSRIDSDIMNLRSEIVRLRNDQVTRAEHEQHWRDAAERTGALSLRLGELQKEYTGGYNIGDQVKNLQKQLDDLRVILAKPIIAPNHP